MRKIEVETINGMRTESVYTIPELSLIRHNLDCKESKKRNVKYLEIPCAFDIETTNIYEKDAAGKIDLEKRPFSFMYHWQFCINDEVCFGRTWKEFQYLLSELTRRMDLDNNRRLVVWCHNFRFEWQHMRRFVKFIDGFFKEDRVPLKVAIDGGIEFRDSYILSNMMLQKFCENTPNVEHFKLSGEEFDYSIRRTPSYKMSMQEEAYCYNDVRGLVECIKEYMKEDTLASMPMTSTGYVRRDARRSMKENPKNREAFLASALTPDLYQLCVEAFRGGDTHANLRLSDQILHDVDSYDIQSSYPACMMMNLYPCSPFFRIKTSTFLNRDLSDYALIIHARFKNIHYVGECGMPYISLSKCRHITSDKIIDNGRVLFAGVIECVCTGIDLDIIMEEYACEDFYIKEVYASRYAPLPPEYKKVVMQYFTGKTSLRGVEGREYEYNKSKNKLNALYGMMAQKINASTTTYDGHDYITTADDIGECLKKYYKSHNSFLSYQNALFVTSWARFRLRKMLRKVGKDCIYCDTDSIKCINGHEEDFASENEVLIQEAIAAGAYAEDKHGNIQYMGLWEHETSDDKGGKYAEFATLGSKKYIFKKGNHYVSTIAGVKKKAGSAFFSKNGIKAFKIGTVIKDSGHLTAFYNDDEIHTIVIDGEEIETASNVALVDNTYTLGVTDEYIDLLEKALTNADNMYYI